MALAIDASSPAGVPGPFATQTTASFTPPNGSLLVVCWAGNSLQSTPANTPTITDNLGTHLTYTLSDWVKYGDAVPTATIAGQAAIWTATGTGVAMTISVQNMVSAASDSALKVLVFTDTGTPTLGAHGKANSISALTTAQNYTAAATGGWGVLQWVDWDAKGAPLAGTGCTGEYLDTLPGQISFGTVRRTTADDTVGVTNTLNITTGGSATSTNASWCYLEVLPNAGGGGTSVALAGSQSNPLHPGKGPGRFSGRRLQKPSNTLPLQASAVIPFVPVGNTRRNTQQILPVRRIRSLAVPGGQITPSYVARRNTRFTVPVRRGRAVTPMTAQVIVPPAYVPGVIRRDTQLTLYVRRGRAANPVPAQVVVPPAYVPGKQLRRTQLIALRRTTNRVGHIPGHALTPPAGANARRDTQLVTYQRRGRVMAPPLAEVVTPVSTRRPRSAWWAPRRGRAITPTPTQAAAPPPTYVLTASRQPGKAKILWQRRGHVTDVVIAQVAAPPPTYVLTPARPPGRRWAALRRGRASWVVPTQTAAPAPSWVPGMARRQVRLLMLRRPARTGHTPGHGTGPIAPMGGATRRDTQLVLYVRRRPVSQPIPAQQAAPVGKFLANLVKRARLWLLPRRKQAVTVVQGGLSAPPGSAQFRSADRGTSMALGDSGIRFTSASGGTGEVAFVDGSGAVEFKDGDTGTEMRSGS